MPENDEESIRFFEALRVQGADWLGIVAEQKKELWQDHARLMSHIQRTCEFTVETPDYVIYRIRGPEKAVMRSPVNRVTELSLVGLPPGAFVGRLGSGAETTAFVDAMVLVRLPNHSNLTR